MTRPSILCVGTALLSATSTFALPLIPSAIDIDFRGTAWSAAGNQAQYTLGGVTASALPTGSLLRHGLGDGLGIDGPILNRIEDPSEVGPLETLVVNFANPTSLVAAYLNDLYPHSLTELIQDRGFLELYNGSSLLATYNFDGSDSSGEKVVAFASPMLVTRVEFKVTFDRSIAEILANRDYAVAGFDVEDPVVRVSDSGTALALFGGGWLCLGLWRRKTATL
ncbi:MAG: hypothetical protein IT581_06160 [Verrucomicrobiales bacterium]|nr:hypothetical protein [Verrucomicrobiales bacterium]